MATQPPVVSVELVCCNDQLDVGERLEPVVEQRFERLARHCPNRETAAGNAACRRSSRTAR